MSLQSKLTVSGPKPQSLDEAEQLQCQRHVAASLPHLLTILLRAAVSADFNHPCPRCSSSFFYFFSLDKSKAPEHLTPGIYYAGSTISLAPVRLSQNCLFKCTCVCKGRLQISKGKYANKDKTLLSANRKKK